MKYKALINILIVAMLSITCFTATSETFTPYPKCVDDFGTLNRNLKGMWGESSPFINANGLEAYQVGVGYMSLDNLIRRCVINITATERFTGKQLTLVNVTNITRSAGAMITDLKCGGKYTEVSATITVDGIGMNSASAALRVGNIFPLQPY